MGVEWTDRLSVGFDPIDAQHRELIGRFNTLLEACQECRGKEKIVELLGYLDQYAASHFGMEEALMERHAYPGVEEHLQEHRYFIRKLNALKESLEQRGPSLELVIQTNQALLSWFVKHIRNIDVKFGAFLRTRLPATSTGGGRLTADPPPAAPGDIAPSRSR